MAAIHRPWAGRYGVEDGSNHARSPRLTWQRQAPPVSVQRRAIARGRLPPWLKALLPTLGLGCVFCVMLLVFAGSAELYRLIHAASAFRRAPGIVLPLLFTGSFVLALGPGFVLANLLLVSVVPLRRVLDRNAQGVPGASFAEGTRSLLRFSAVSVPIGLACCAAAVAIPWSP